MASSCDARPARDARAKRRETMHADLSTIALAEPSPMSEPWQRVAKSQAASRIETLADMLAKSNLAIGHYSGLAIRELRLKQSVFYVHCGPKIWREQCC